MNKSHHELVVNLLREGLAEHPDFKSYFEDRSLEQLYRTIFHSYRGGSDAPKGWRLTFNGLRMMETLYRAYRIELREDVRIGANELLYLDGRAKLPYYLAYEHGRKTGNRLVVFENLLGTLLKLVDGDVSNLVEMEGR